MIATEYVIQKFYEYNGSVKFLKLQNAYNGSCYICKEGSSWLKKRRCYYLVDKGVVCCHNCGWHNSAPNWIMEVTGKTFSEVLQESKEYDHIPTQYKETDLKRVVNVDYLPKDSINLLDTHQVEFYKNEKTVQTALELIASRNLLKAINRPRSLWVSLNDFVHKDRLVVPFYNRINEIIYYQTRSLYPDDGKPRYLSKIGTPKSLFGIDKITNDIDYIFIFEGPINAFFTQNSVAVCGIQENSKNNFTALQAEQLKQYPLHKKIWVLDSQWIDEASYKKTSILIEQNESVFIWPKDYGSTYKDFNDIAIKEKKNEIDINFVLNNTYTGLKAKILLSSIKSLKK